ncbi:fatty acyl-AMP ligase [Algibacillus agarilyticus]|uniref:fatty acyl-AMP ligase n=1 Tax=Algibacillus agarilyticus TaxID=2234133 RepID=UPI000DD0BBAF|nr:fatty acyl-AMP ligase [Algibacillus agarilyticus]
MKSLIPFEGDSLIELVNFRAQVQPNDVAYTHLKDRKDEKENITYAEFQQRILTLAAHIQSYNVKGERIILMYPTGIDYIVAYFAVIFAGAIAVPVYEPRQSSHFNRLANILADAQPKLLLTLESTLAISSKDALDELAQFGATWLTTDNLPLNNKANEKWQPISLKPDDITFLQYTSGSTGAPKGVMVSNANLLHNSSLIHKNTQSSADSCCVTWLPPYHDMGLIGGLLQPLYAGFHCVILSPISVIQRPIKLLKAIHEYKATISGGPNFIFEACVNRIRDKQLAGIDLSSWRIAFNGAEPINANTLQRFAQRFASHGFNHNAFYPCYGMAETTLFVAGSQANKGAIYKKVDRTALQQNIAMTSQAHDAQTLVSSGHLHNDLCIKVVDPLTCLPCKEGEIGEVWIQGASIAQGYWQRKSVLGTDFSGMLAGDPNQLYLRSGDYAFVDDGQLFITGRLKDLIIIRGKNHYPQDIEYSVSHSHIELKPDTGAAFSVPHADEEVLVIMHELNHRLDFSTQQEIKQTMIESISKNHEMQVFDIVFIRPGTLPKTTSGKIQRQAARKQYLLNHAPANNTFTKTKSTSSSERTETRINSKETNACH